MLSLERQIIALCNMELALNLGRQKVALSRTPMETELSLEMHMIALCNVEAEHSLGRQKIALCKNADGNRA